jgi:hypothetical protein
MHTDRPEPFLTADTFYLGYLMRQLEKFIVKRSLAWLATALFCAGVAACGGGNAPADMQSSSGGQGNAATLLASTVVSAPNTVAVNGTSPTPAQMQALSLFYSRSSDPRRARFNGPQGIKLCSSTGDLYVADTLNYTIRKITRAGVVTTFAGMAGIRGSADGIGSSALFTEPRGIAMDAASNVYVTDGSVVRKITPSRVVKTIAGLQGAFGVTDGAGSAARFDDPEGIVVDGAGNLFVADFDVSALTIRKITRTGIVTTFAGGNTGGSTEIPHDDTGTKARFVGPKGLAIDQANNLYVTDIGRGGLTAPNLNDGSSFIRKVFPSGVVKTIAGNYGFTTLPAGGPLAEFSLSTGIAVDGAGNLFVIDHFNNSNRIKKIASSGAISVLPVDPGNFGFLSGILIDTASNLFVSDSNNHIISKVTQAGAVTVYAGKTGVSGSADTP